MTEGEYLYICSNRAICPIFDNVMVQIESFKS